MDCVTGGRVAQDILFYDGRCGLCHWAVRFVLRRDDHGRFLFAPLQGETFARLVPAGGPLAGADTVLVLHGDRLLQQSDAVLHVLRHLGGGWRCLGFLGAVLPRPLRDGLYDALARRRQRLFASPPDLCPIVPAEWRSRFLP